MPTKRATNAAKARNEETKVLRGVRNPASRINPRRPINRPHLADPVSGYPMMPANLSQNPRGGF